MKKWYGEPILSNKGKITRLPYFVNSIKISLLTLVFSAIMGFISGVYSVLTQSHTTLLFNITIFVSMAIAWVLSVFNAQKRARDFIKSSKNQFLLLVLMMVPFFNIIPSLILLFYPSSFQETEEEPLSKKQIAILAAAVLMHVGFTFVPHKTHLYLDGLDTMEEYVAEELHQEEALLNSQ